MKSNSKGGYTILETLIFLAVSGLMFIVAAGFIDGKQGRVEFRQAVTDVNTQINSVISSVENGTYSTNNDFSCRANGVAGTLQIDNTSSSSQGQNKECVFTGKIIQFGVNDTVNVDKRSAYNVYTVVGRQFGTNPTDEENFKPPLNFSSAGIKIVDAESVTEKKALQWNLHITRMRQGTTTDAGAIGFFKGFASTAGTGLESGSQSVVALAIPSTKLDDDSNNGVKLNPPILTAMDASIAAPPNVYLCFMGREGQYAKITIGGGNGQRLKTSVEIKDSNNVIASGCPNADTF